MSEASFGKYIPLNSPLHKMDLRAKPICLIILLVSVLVPASWYAYAALAVLVLCIVHSTGLGPRFVLKTAAGLLVLGVFLLILNIWTLKTGDVVLSFSIFSKTITVFSGALEFTAKVFIRLLLMLLLAGCLTASTKPLDLTLAIEYILSPLKFIGIPTYAVSMMISIAFRFIPTFRTELDRIRLAQKSRGLDTDGMNVFKKINGVLSLTVPLFVIAFERAYELADAMEARGYVPGAPRTRLYEPHFQISDFICMILSLVVLALCITSRIFL